VRRPTVWFAVILFVLGLVWIGQGLGAIPGSFMTGNRFWAMMGLILVVMREPTRPIRAYSGAGRPSHSGARRPRSGRTVVITSTIGRVALRASGLLLIGLLAAGCSAAATPTPSAAGPTGSTPTTEPTSGSTTGPTTAPTTAPTTGSTGVVVNTASTTLGPVLTGPNGLTLYTHAGDTATTSTCTGACATAWPPLAVAAGGSATGGAGVTGTFATLTRDDGTLQVTYNGLPLYGWMSDTKAGDVTGQGINGFTVAVP
jgi:predicted lipoprotein with Yx(FWY)xxD motif